jgi:NTE family protein
MNLKTGWMVVALLALAVLAGCVTHPASTDSTINDNRPRVALVLGGGAARGFAHVGVIRALEQEKIPIDLIVGTSVGSLIGALYAHEMNSFELEWTAFTLERDDLLDYALLSASMGPIKGERLETFVNKKVPVVNIESLKIPFAAVATDLNRGTRVVLDHGPLAPAVHASCAIPGVFQPVEYQGRLLVDGGTVDNLPVAVARAKGADIVIAVDISQNVTNYNITNFVDVTLQAMHIMFNENVSQQRRDADILISPAVGDVGMMDFTQKKRLMQAGMDAGQQAATTIHRLIDEWKSKHDQLNAVR